ncbi:MAG: hypothetical protein PF961_11005, partial [Planctomycetota bacterium]|nr:hypothetical protein [Planctomycetota bacterium]
TSTHPYITNNIPRWPVVAPLTMATSLPPGTSTPATGNEVLSAYGRSLTSDNVTEIDRSWAGATMPNRFTATRKWEAADRCRQLVFWLADWQSYQDFEELPPEPTESALYTFTPEGKIMNVDREPFRMPEGQNLWSSSSRTGTINWGDFIKDGTQWWNNASIRDNRAAYWGQYGVDRNHNGSFDQGELPPGTRIHAVTIARFNFYESIGIGSLSH